MVENTVFCFSFQDFMNGVCTHIVRLNEHTKKLDYYTGNYDSYVREASRFRTTSSKENMMRSSATSRRLKDFIARCERGILLLFRFAAGGPRCSRVA